MEALQDDLYLETSQAYLGQWNKLVSTTNWEKGRIILNWRQALVANGAPVAEYSDETWSRRVGNVSPQHVGRLRRVFEQFGERREEFGGLFWSHFQATLDWEDAEMWLEGAVQNRWSVAQMKNQRWEALGAPDELKPREEDIYTGELDEDVDPQVDGQAASTVEASLGVVEGPYEAADEATDADDGENLWDPTESIDETQPAVASSYEEIVGGDQEQPAAERVRLFENLPNLPEDVADALESFKLAILRHKLRNWQEVNRADVLNCLDALKALAVTEE